MGHLNPECTLYWCEERSRVIKTSQGGSISTLADNDDSLQNDYVVKCQSRSCLRETAAAKQWAWESEWVYFFFFFTRLAPDARWTPSCPKTWFQRASGELRDKRERKGAMSGEEKDAEEAALADAPSSQLTESLINSLVLQGTVANHQAWLPNTLT